MKEEKSRLCPMLSTKRPRVDVVFFSPCSPCRHPLDHSPNRSGSAQNEIAKKKLPHIKKPLNAFMLFMKEMRAKVIAECTLKESAAINQILGRRVSGSSTSIWFCL